MSKSTQKGHGGKREGAGRKPKSLTTLAKSPEVIKAAENQVMAMAEASDGPASALVGEAFAALRDVMNNSPYAAPRVSAARAIIDLAKLERAADRDGSPVGKKEIAKATAKASAVGKFAVPPPPSSGADRLQ